MAAGMPRVAAVAGVAMVLVVMRATTASAQAAVPPARTGSVTFVSQAIDHIGRLLDDGSRISGFRTMNLALDVEVEYGITDRLAISGGVPYVFAKYLGGPPPPFLPYTPADTCHCLHRGWQDVGLGLRYNLVNVHRTFMLTPSVSVGVPSHAYNYVGEAVIGFDLKDVSLGADASQRLDAIAPGLSLQARYDYTVVQRVLGIAHNRSNGTLEGDLSLTRHVSARGILNWQRTHGGLRIPAHPSDIGGPTDEVTPFPDRLVEFHRLLRDNYLQAGAGVSYSGRNWDASASFLTAVKGTNSHLVHVFTVDISWLFDRSKGV